MSDPTPDTPTMVRTHLVIDGDTFQLAQGQDLPQLREQIEAAAGSSGRFVDFMVVGNRSVGVLISSGMRIVFSVETVQYDERDTGLQADPFGGMFDF